MTTKPKRPRVLAICLFLHERRILAAKGLDDKSGENFYRPFGGGVKFGETSADALRREIREELGQEIDDVRLLRVLENIFVFNGEVGHEVVFVYNARFLDEQIYGRTEVDGIEEEKKLTLQGRWVHISDVLSGQATIYPLGLSEVIAQIASP